MKLFQVASVLFCSRRKRSLALNQVYPSAVLSRHLMQQEQQHSLDAAFTSMYLGYPLFDLFSLILFDFTPTAFLQARLQCPNIKDASMLQPILAEALNVSTSVHYGVHNDKLNIIIASKSMASVNLWIPWSS